MAGKKPCACDAIHRHPYPGDRDVMSEDPRAGLESSDRRPRYSVFANGDGQEGSPSEPTAVGRTGGAGAGFKCGRREPRKPEPATDAGKRGRCRSKAAGSGTVGRRTCAPGLGYPAVGSGHRSRTSLVQDSVKRRIFAYMDQGDRSAEIETKSGLSHLIVKHYRRMWKDERHDARLQSLKNRSSRKACSRARASSYAPVQLPLRLKPGCGQRPEMCPGPKSVGDRGMRKHRAAGGVQGPGRKGAGSGVQETADLQVEASNSPVSSETQLVIRLMEKPAARWPSGSQGRLEF